MQETTSISVSSQDLHFAQSSSEGFTQSHGEQGEPGGILHCSQRTRTGRPCLLPVLDTASGLCFRHAGLRKPRKEKKDPEDLSADLLAEITEFPSANEVNQFLARLLFLLVRNRISPKRAGVLTYIAAQLLHSLRQIDRENEIAANAPLEIICDIPRPIRD